jgi:hypothetical protein
MNRHERRKAEARRRKLAARHARVLAMTGDDRSADPDVRKGIAITTRAVDFKMPNDLKGGGACLFRSLVALEAMRRCKIDGQIEIGSMLYRVGPDPYRDVVAFCGPSNAGIHTDVGALFHVWISVNSCIADFSVGDWRALADRRDLELALPGAPDLGPIQWTIPDPPNYWWRPRAELTGRWSATGTPELGEVWYGPYNGDPLQVHQIINETREDIGEKIERAVDEVMNRAAQQMGLERPNHIPAGYQRINPTLVQTEIAKPPPGYQRIMLSDLLRIVGTEIDDDFHDAVTYVSHIPQTRDEVMELLKNMTITIPPGR